MWVLMHLKLFSPSVTAYAVPPPSSEGGNFFVQTLCLPGVWGAGVLRTPLRSRSTDRGGSRDGGAGIRLGGVVTDLI